VGWPLAAAAHWCRYLNRSGTSATGSGLDPATDEAALRAQTRLVHEWRRFPFLDPRLPAQLLPDNWSGAKAADLFHTRHADWHPAAQRHWERLTADTGAG